MGTNTTVLIIVTAMAALVLVGAVVVVGRRTRTSRRPVTGTTIPDQADEGALRLQRQEALADECDARVHAAQVEIDIKTVRACGLQEEATLQRNEADTSRNELNELRDTADKLSAAAHNREMPPPVGLMTLHT